MEALLQRSKKRELETSPRGQSALIGFLPVKGGVGNSTLALNVAFELAHQEAQEEEGKRVLLIELKEGGGTLAIQLNREASSGIQTLAENWSAHLSPESLLPHLIQDPSGLHVLPAERSPQRSTDTHWREKFLEHLLPILKTEYDYILFDLPPSLDAPISEILQQSQYILLTLEPPEAILELARDFIRQLERWEVGTYKIHPVTVYRTPLQAKMTAAAVQQTLHLELLTSIPAVPTLVEESWKRGVPLSTLQSDNPISRQVLLIVEEIRNTFRSV